MYGSGLHVLDLSRARQPGALALFANECRFDTNGIAMPRAEVHLAVRFGVAPNHAIDVHVLGPRLRAHRKPLRGGMRSVLARLPLGVPEAVFGVPSLALAGRIVPLDALWDGAAHTLAARMADARDVVEAAAVLEQALTARLRTAPLDGRAGLVREAALRLSNGRVQEVAQSLGVSERHLRRVFRESVGMGPKEFAKLARFRRAVREACREPRADWARIAAAVGYYDQAHLIAEFRELSGVTPRVLLEELTGSDVAGPRGRAPARQGGLPLRR